MSKFNTKTILHGSSTLIPIIADNIQREFKKDDFDVSMEQFSSGGYDISITKGGFFKSVLGMKTALKVTLLPEGDSIKFEAGVGIWGQQAIPTVISMLFFWPVLITQIWGMVEQAKLDDKALKIASDVLSDNDNIVRPDISNGKFCTNCGAKNPETARFCCNCGKPL